MQTTSLSLLQRVKNPNDKDAWGRLVDLYGPFLHTWGRQAGLSDTDSADLTQEVLVVLAQQLPSFQYDAAKSFRGWLKTVTINRAKNYHRAAAIRPTIGVDSAIVRAASTDTAVDLFDELEYRAYLTKRLIAIVRTEFEDSVWQAFEMQMLQERSASDVSKELGISVNRVYLAKSRVLRRLREEAANLLD